MARSPTWYPLESAGQASVRLVRLDERAYRAASFLDRRILTAQPQEATCDSEVLRAGTTTLAPALHYIFHIGHVGSTLISRLIGEHERFFSLREPALLREIDTGGAPGLEVLLRLLARTWRPGQRVVVKATSFVSEIATTLLASSVRPRAVLMYSQPAAYLRCILGGPNSRIEAQRLAPSRLKRLGRWLEPGEWQAQLHSEGEYLAMSWLCEMTALHRAATRSRTPGETIQAPVLWVDFDAFLAEPAPGLAEIFRALGESPDAREIETLITSPLMRQYSKAPEHPYDAELRRQVLAAADEQFSAEIARGMEWLHRTAARHPTVAQVLEKA